MLKTISPIDNKVCFEKNYNNIDDINDTIYYSKQLSNIWKNYELKKRIKIISKFVENLLKKNEYVAKRLTIEMGRPIKYSRMELSGFKERADYMISIAKRELDDKVLTDNNNVKKIIKRVPYGIGIIIPAWNYPYLITANSLIPSLIAGNTVIFKGSSQTPSVGIILKETMDETLEDMEETDLKNIFLNLILDHKDTQYLVGHKDVKYVNFTGSVEGGKQILKSSTENGFKSVTLELGGKDSAYVSDNANLKLAAKEICSGSFFNSGQCCCAIERVYVHRSVYDEFLSLVKKEAEKIIFGNPLDEDITMGPLAKLSQATYVKKLIQQAKSFGATQVLNQLYFKNSIANENYVPPQILVEVGHNMEIMNDETFGPVMPIMKVSDDKAAIECINACNFGLTNSIWTRDIERGEELCDMIESGTCFINKCDYLDPMLPWSGVKDTGMGCSLSYLGYLSVTRPKSYYLNKNL